MCIEHYANGRLDVYGGMKARSGVEGENREGDKKTCGEKKCYDISSVSSGREGKRIDGSATVGYVFSSGWTRPVWQCASGIWRALHTGTGVGSSLEIEYTELCAAGIPAPSREAKNRESRASTAAEAARCAPRIKCFIFGYRPAELVGGFEPREKTKIWYRTAKWKKPGHQKNPYYSSELQHFFSYKYSEFWKKKLWSQYV